jgi:GcrA cell cycle regulator
MIDWSDATIARLRELHDCKTLTARGIAQKLVAEFNQPFTRGAVLAKRWRLGLLTPKSHKKLTVRVPRVRKPSSQARRWLPKIQPPTMPEEEIREAVVTDQFQCSIMELENVSCRYPIGEVGDLSFRYCGCPQADMSSKRPYCDAHARIAYRPSHHP